MIPHCTNDDVIIHESARPLVRSSHCHQLIDSQFRNVSLMSEISFTVAPVDPGTSAVTGSLDRSRLRNVQLPQKFSRSDLQEAHDSAVEKQIEYTEDATLVADRSEEHTSELQSRGHLVCRLLLEKKNLESQIHRRY